MVNGTTFNNISVISWQSVLLEEESRVHVDNHRPVASHWHTLSHNVVSSTTRLSGVRTHNVGGDWHWLHTLLSNTLTIMYINNLYFTPSCLHLKYSLSLSYKSSLLQWTIVLIREALVHVVYYFFSISKIWPDKRGSLSLEGPYKVETTAFSCLFVSENNILIFTPGCHYASCPILWTWSPRFLLRLR